MGTELSFLTDFLNEMFKFLDITGVGYYQKNKEKKKKKNRVGCAKGHIYQAQYIYIYKIVYSN